MKEYNNAQNHFKEEEPWCFTTSNPFLSHEKNKTQKYVTVNHDPNTVQSKSQQPHCHHISQITSGQSICFCHSQDTIQSIITTPYIYTSKQTNASSSSSISKAFQNYNSILQNQSMMNHISRIHEIYKSPNRNWESVWISHDNLLETCDQHSAQPFPNSTWTNHKDQDEIDIDCESEEDTIEHNVQRYYTHDKNEIDLDADSFNEDNENNEDNSINEVHCDTDGINDVRDSITKPIESKFPMMERNKPCGIKYDNDDNILPQVPHLLVLGTGCASPSALRGSSGYALLFPTCENISNHRAHKLTAIIDCGEGCLTALSRYYPSSLSSSSSQDSNDLIDKLKEIKFIWISHAHYDHYGGMPTLLHAIHDARSNSYDTCHYCHFKSHNQKRQKTFNSFDPSGSHCSCLLAPLVIAPRKVLRYLDSSLNVKNGLNKSFIDSNYSQRPIHSLPEHERNDDRHRMFFGVTHQEFESSPFAKRFREMIFDYKIPYHSTFFKEVGVPPSQNKETDNHSVHHYPHHHQKHHQQQQQQQQFFYRPFTALRSVPVEHCPCAYALICGIQYFHTIMDRNGSRHEVPKTFYFCYSGDTRPSTVLVKSCQQIGSGHKISLCLHESTFDNDLKGQTEAIKKKHSTVKEALMVADQINADACILTHFSQRYPNGVLNDRCHSNLKMKNTPESTNYIHCKNISVAVDGFCMPLTEHSVAALPIINECLMKIFENAVDG